MFGNMEFTTPSKVLATDAVAKAGHGTMICLVPPDDLLPQLAMEGGEDPAELHVTVLYLGKGLAEAQLSSVAAIVEQAATQYAPLVVEVGGAGRFPASESSDGKDALIRLVSVPRLEALREELIQAFRGAGIEPVLNFGYTPHMTLAYVPEGTVGECTHPERVSFIADGIWVVTGDSWEEFSFTGEEVLKREILFDDLEKFNANHDRQGRFASSGGGAASSKAVAGEILAKAKEAEPELTAALKDLAAEAGGEMSGLEFRFKGEDSLRRKLLQRTRDKGTSMEEEGANIGDALRFTMLLPPDRYAAGLQTSLTRIEAKHGKITERDNYWPPNNEYRGYHINIKAKNGLNVEVQFHTPESFALKRGANEKLYHSFRKTKSPSAKYKLYKQMQANSAALKTPKGALTVCCPKLRQYSGPLPAGVTL